MEKIGEKYKELKYKFQPFDLVLFRGGEFVSDIISYLEEVKLGKGAGDYSHVGMIVTSDILDHPKVEKNKLYIWESTISGFLGEGVKNIQNKSFLGVQLRDFDEVAPAYDNHPDTYLGWSPMYKEIREQLIERPKIKEEFTKIFNKYNGIPYDANIFSLMGALFQCCRDCREFTEVKGINHNWLFCSELCFKVYQELGVYEKKFDPSNVVPVDFIGYDEDGIPVLFDKPVRFTCN